MDYDAEDDFAKSIDACYAAIRERKAKGGPGWMPMNDQILACARNLAQALMDFGYTRKPEDHQRVLALQTELCRIVRRESTEQEKA